MRDCLERRLINCFSRTARSIQRLDHSCDDVYYLSDYPKGTPSDGRGVLGLVRHAGAAFGPTISGWVLENMNWQWLFLMNIPIGLVAIWFVYAYSLLPDERSEELRRTWFFDGHCEQFVFAACAGSRT